MWRTRIVWRKIVRDEWIKRAGFHLHRWNWNRRGLSESHGSSHILHNCIYHFQIYSLIQWPPPVVCQWASLYLLPCFFFRFFFFLLLPIEQQMTLSFACYIVQLEALIYLLETIWDFLNNSANLEGAVIVNAFDWIRLCCLAPSFLVTMSSKSRPLMELPIYD